MMQPTLLIADSDVFQQQLIDMLLAVDDYKLITATTGREALEHLKRQTPQLIMLADNLPDTTGADLCARIRGVRRFLSVPIILTSSADNAQNIARLAPAVHASLALAKPLGNKHVRDHVRDLIEAAPTPENDQVSNDRVSQARAEQPAALNTAALNTGARKPQLPETFEVKDSDTALKSQRESQQAPVDGATEALTKLEPDMSEEEYVRSILAKGSVVPLKEENVSKLSIFQSEAAEAIPQNPPSQVNELDEDLLLTEADLTELTIYTAMDIEPNVSPITFADEAVVKPAPSFTQNLNVETIKAEAPKPIKLENFEDTYDVHVSATRPQKLSSSEEAAHLVTNTQDRNPQALSPADASAEPKEPKSRKLGTLIEQPFNTQPPKRELSSPKPESSGRVLDGVVHDGVVSSHELPSDEVRSNLTTNPALEIHELADEDTRKRSSKDSHRLTSQDLLKDQELEQLSRQVEMLLQENDQLKEAIRELEGDQPLGTRESYLDAVEELEALRRLSEHQGRQLTKLYGENRYLREKQQEPLKPEPPRKTIWDKLKL